MYKYVFLFYYYNCKIFLHFIILQSWIFSTSLRILTETVSLIFLQLLNVHEIWRESTVSHINEILYLHKYQENDIEILLRKHPVLSGRPSDL